jgi:hypothetical protein
MLSFIVSIVIAADCLISHVVITHEVSKAHRVRPQYRRVLEISTILSIFSIVEIIIPNSKGKNFRFYLIQYNIRCSLKCPDAWFPTNSVRNGIRPRLIAANPYAIALFISKENISRSVPSNLDRSFKPTK